MPATKPSLHLRLPPDVHAEAVAQAEAFGVSLNAWLVMAARNWVAYKRRDLGPVVPPPKPAATAAPAKAVSGEWPKASRPAASLPLASPTVSKVGRNAPCPCGSGLKFERCHGRS